MSISRISLSLHQAFVHPEAKDYNRIYRYNYGATKLALHRALDKFPDEKTLVYEKTGQHTVSWDSRFSASGTRRTSRSRWTSWTWARSPRS